MSPGDHITIMFQDDNDPEGARQRARIIWDDDSRKVFASVIAEACAHTMEHVAKNLGVEPGTHAAQHQALDKLLPWLDAMKRKEEAKAEFFESLVKENAKRMASALWWIILGAVVYGLADAGHWLKPLFNVVHP